MNQRDQNRHERNRYEQQRPEQGLRGQRQGRYGAMPEAGTTDTGQRQPSRSRFTDTYNPEPQWLREDEPGRRYGQPLGGGDYDRNDEDYRGGRHAATGQGRQYGARQQGGGAMEYERNYGRQDYGSQDYGRERGFGQRMGGRWDEDHPEAGQYQGAYGEYGAGRFEEEDRGGYGRTGYGASRHASGYRESEYRGQGYGADYGSLGQRSRSGRQFVSDYGGGGYDQVSGTYGYRGRGAYATGDYQSGMEGQRSYRGFGPQTYQRSDDRIRDDVCERLTDDARIDASNVTIDVNQGAVTLSGTVPERYMRYAAEDLVDDAMGVESINNQLRVQARGTQSSGMQSSGTQSSGMQSSGDTSMASGSRATAPSEMEKQKH